MLVLAGDYGEGYRIGSILGHVAPVVILVAAIVFYIRGRYRTSRFVPVFLLLVAWNVLVIVHPFGRSDPSHEQANVRAGIIDGCSTQQPWRYCECLATELMERRGLDTVKELRPLLGRLRHAQRTQRTSDVPEAFAASARACA